MNNITKKISDVFPINIVEKLSEVSLLYSGKHNITYSAFLQKQKVQIRIVKANWVDRKNEITFLKSKSNYIYIDSKGNFIKEWIEGSDLSNLKISLEDQIKIIKEIQNFHKQNSSLKLDKFDWFSVENNDDHFKKLLIKNANLPLVVSHNDIRLKNIIKEINGAIHLIDFEWVRLNNEYFDFVHLYLYCNFDINFIIQNTNLNKEIFMDFIYIIKSFNKNWEKKKYK